MAIEAVLDDKMEDKLQLLPLFQMTKIEEDSYRQFHLFLVDHIFRLAHEYSRLRNQSHWRKGCGIGMERHQSSLDLVSV